MIGKTQFDFFKSVYDEESRRLESLIDRAKIYLSIVSIFFGGAFFKFDWLVGNRDLIGKGAWIFGVGFACFVVALILICFALQMYMYDELADPNEIIDTERLEAQSQTKFFKRRIADYAAAYEQNSRLNDRRATLLQWGLWLIVLGVVLIAAGILRVLA